MKKRSRLVVFILLLVSIGLGLASRRFAGALPAFIVDHAGDGLWAVAVYLTLCLIKPSWAPLRIFALAVAISFAVELSQLLDVRALNAIRQTSIGRLFLGVGFLWVDLVRYTVGASLAFAVDEALARFTGARVRPTEKGQDAGSG